MDDLLLRPGNYDPRRSDRANSIHLAQAIRCGLDEIEDRLAECLDELLGVHRANPADRPGREIRLDAFEGCRRRRAEKARAELDPVGAVVDPVSTGRDPLARRDGSRGADDRHQVPVSPRLHAEDAESGLLIMKGHAFHETGQDFTVRGHDASRHDCSGGPMRSWGMMI